MKQLAERVSRAIDPLYVGELVREGIEIANLSILPASSKARTVVY
jgi:hypothetical protein